MHTLAVRGEEVSEDIRRTERLDPVNLLRPNLRNRTSDLDRARLAAIGDRNVERDGIANAGHAERPPGADHGIEILDDPAEMIDLPVDRRVAHRRCRRLPGGNTEQAGSHEQRGAVHSYRKRWSSADGP